MRKNHRAEFLQAIHGANGHAPSHNQTGSLRVAGRAQENDAIGSEEDLAICRQHVAIVSAILDEVRMDSLVSEELLTRYQRRFHHLRLNIQVIQVTMPTTQ